MRFLSKYPKFRLMPIGDLTEPLANGAYRTLKQGIKAEFHQEALQPWEEELARTQFAFTGIMQEQDGTPVDPIFRVSVWDTDEEAERYNWDPDLKSQVEENMMASLGYGVDFVAVTKPAVPKPWPSYDDFKTADEIAAFVATAGIDPQAVLDYEQSNLNRPAVIKALGNVEVPETVKA